MPVVARPARCIATPAPGPPSPSGPRTTRRSAPRGSWWTPTRSWPSSRTPAWTRVAPSWCPPRTRQASPPSCWRVRSPLRQALASPSPAPAPVRRASTASEPGCAPGSTVTGRTAYVQETSRSRRRAPRRSARPPEPLRLPCPSLRWVQPLPSPRLVPSTRSTRTRLPTSQEPTTDSPQRAVESPSRPPLAPPACSPSARAHRPRPS